MMYLLLLSEGKHSRTTNFRTWHTERKCLCDSGAPAVEIYKHHANIWHNFSLHGCHYGMVCVCGCFSHGRFHPKTRPGTHFMYLSRQIISWFWGWNQSLKSWQNDNQSFFLHYHPNCWVFNQQWDQYTITRTVNLHLTESRLCYSNTLLISPWIRSIRHFFTLQWNNACCFSLGLHLFSVYRYNTPYVYLSHIFRSSTSSRSLFM